LKPIAFLVLAAAWGCIFLAPSGSVSRLIQFLVFLALGSILVLLGFVSHYWDSHMRPGEQSVFILMCGLGTLASQIGTVYRVIADEADEAFPGGTRRKPRLGRKR
jgi:hypothetical protein